jgi:general secretion pathway protein C
MRALVSRLNTANLTSPTALRRALWGVVFALVALLGYVCAGMATWLLGHFLESRFPPPPPAAPRADAEAVRVRKPVAAFDSILTHNIFHARRSAAAAAETVSRGAPAPLRLTLSGVFIAGNTGFAFIVGPDGRSEQVYQPGDCVPRAGEQEGPDCTAGQGRLTRVLADRIVVTFGGQPTVFMLEQNPADTTGASGAAAGRAPAPEAPPAAGGPLPATRTGNIIEVHVPNAEVEKAFENFAEIVKQARVVPYSRDGVTVGFQIQNIAPGSVFQRLGLQNFDIVKAVNGESLSSADQALRLFTVFRNERDVVLDVQRQNEQLKLAYVIE